MMKKVIAIALSVMVFALAACGKPKPLDATPTPTVSAATASVRATAPATIGAVATAGMATAEPATTVVLPAETPLPDMTTAPPPPEPTAFPTVAQTGETGIAGYVTLGPMCPVQRADVPCPDKPYSARLSVWRGTEKVAETRSSESGSFKISVEPGTYRLVGESDATLPHGSEQSVVVRSGQLTAVVVMFDTGIR